jgi:tRNA-(ms[2]io[6]A)-hydroxylase
VGAVTADFALASTTPEWWASAAAQDPLALLSDHAHCELKAAANAMTMLKRNPDRAGWPLQLSTLAREEMEHLQRVLRELEARGVGLSQDQPSPYATGLNRFARLSRRGSAGGSGFLDVVLVSALIEMRSHERLLCLARCETLAELAPLYLALCEAEQRHGQLFLRLAMESSPTSVIRTRFDQLAAHEAELLEQLRVGPRVHSGLSRCASPVPDPLPDRPRCG